MSSLKALQEAVDKGQLQINVTTAQGAEPIRDAKISLSYTGDPMTSLKQITTNESGQTDVLDLDAPSIDYSMEPSEIQPYAEYTINVSADGYLPIDISGIEVLPESTAIQPVDLTKAAPPEEQENNIVIGAHTLYGVYPPKIPEDEIKPVSETGEIVLSRVVIPEFIVVHDGVPEDSTAANYYVRYKDYIKNVASSEIYATWPDASLRANILAIMSFTLNRVYTEWYRGKGYNFTITSSTAYDHKFIYGRNNFTNISQVVDEMFGNYLSRPNVKQPILTQYCDGNRTKCPNWMTFL